MNRLERLWAEQKAYNERLFAQDKQRNPDYWTEKYLLGLISEVNEILSDINWKRHQRRTEETNLYNLRYELADVFKYLMSLCQIWDISLYELLQASEEKTEYLEQRWRQEFEEIPIDRPILITDIDGTLGDWRAAFIKWCESSNIPPLMDDPVTSLLLDTDLAMRYSEYYILKEEFEKGGGYRTILPYHDAVSTMQALKAECDVYIIAHTARPQTRYHRIWYDTWTWLKDNAFPVDQLHMGSEFRLLQAIELSTTRNVILWEDDPGLMLRAAHSGLKVFSRRHKYNEEILHPNIRTVGRYSLIPVREYFRT